MPCGFSGCGSSLVNTVIPILCIFLIFCSVFVIIEVEAAKKKILTEQQKLLSTAEVPDNKSQHMVANTNSTSLGISANSLVMEHDKCLMYLRDINADPPAKAISNLTGKADIMDLHVNMTMCDFLFLPHVFNNTHHNIQQ